MTQSATSPREHLVVAEHSRLRVWEWGQEFRGRKPSLLMTHATGFHGRCWDAVVRHLGDRHIVCIDQRGHGGSEGEIVSDWRELGKDLVQVLEALDLNDVYAIGHSMGGAVTFCASVMRPDRISKVMLIDPVIMPPEIYETRTNPMAAANGKPHPITLRRASFESLEQMQEVLAAKPPYSLFAPEVLKDYCRFGTCVAGDEIRLSCAPEFEASIYESLLGYSSIFQDLPKLDQPVTVVRAKEPTVPEHLRSFLYSPTFPALAEVFPNGRDIYLAALTHFIPQQSPELCAGLILGTE